MYSSFINKLNNDLETTSNLMNCYTSNNVEHIYKYNHYAILKEIQELTNYLHNTLKDEQDLIRQIKLHLNNAYSNELVRLKGMNQINKIDRVGIKETYYNYLKVIDML